MDNLNYLAINALIFFIEALNYDIADYSLPIKCNFLLFGYL
jgi:hypothetical protein